MTITEKTKTINHKIEQNKAQYDLDRQNVKISALSSGNVTRWKKAATFENSRLSRWKKQLILQKNSMKD